jgi:hypothetical protein
MCLLTPQERKVLSIFQRGMHNEIAWAFVDGSPQREDRYDDIGIRPSASVADDVLLTETETDLEDAYVWVKTL